MTESIDIQAMEMSVAAAFVFLYSRDRFNTPRSNRSTTTAFRYHTGALSYALCGLALFFVLTLFRPLIGYLWGGHVPEHVQSLSTPFVAALTVTVLLPSVPVLASLDERVRHAIQRFAWIPAEARRISRALRVAEFNPPSEVRDIALNHFREKTSADLDPLAAGAGPVLNNWAKAAVLLRQLERQEAAENAMGRYLANERARLRSLRQRHDKLTAQVTSYANLKLSGSVDAADANGLNPSKEFEKSLVARVEELLEEVCDFVSRAVLQVYMTKARRRAHFAALGFRFQFDAWLTWDQVAAVFLMLTLVALVGFLVSSRVGGPTGIGIMLAKSMVVAFVGTIAINAGALFKEIVGARHQGSGKAERWSLYFAAGAAAALLGAVVLFLAYLVAEGDIESAVEELRWVDAWLFVVFWAAFLTTMQTDAIEKARAVGDKHRYYEAALQGFVFCVGTILLYSFDPEINDFVDANSNVVFVAALALSAGTAVGYTIPTWTRKLQAADRVENSFAGALAPPDITE